MDFFEVVKKRGSYRNQFEEKAIPDEDIRKMLDAGIKAPSGYNLQTTSFVVVTDPKLRGQIAELMPSDATKTAPVILVVVSEHVEADGLCFEIEDYASATETLLLAITAMGYASVWMDGDTKSDGNFEKIKEILGLPENKTVRTILPVGIPVKEVTQNTRKAFEERVSYNKAE
ncbi:nitroreductase family protein [bacterium 210820-DFI.6.37]|nr:nitroreductase family protein [bacterium 210820-DFI.6.37]